ncbi:MAG: hypothetical protein RJA36_3961 [Pseudomonadota bacterium]|jgi:hypothetical protein
MSVSGTPGTGTITLGSAQSGYQSLASAYGANATVDVVITDGTAWEVARNCTYTHSGTTLSRGTLEASSTGSALSLTSAAVVSVTLTADRARAHDAAALEYLAGTDADTTMVVNRLYVVDMSAWATANRTYTLPATAAVGDRIGIMVTSGNASYELLITAGTGDTLNGVAGGTEWSRLFITNEVVIMRCVVANSTWLVEQDGRVPQFCLMRLSTSTTGNEAASTWTSPTSISGAWTADADNASLASTANNRFKVRRAGNYLLSAAGRSVSSQNDQELFGVVLWKNGTSTLIGTNQGRVSGTGNFYYAVWPGASSGIPLAAGDTVNYQFQTSNGSRNLFASGYNSFFSGAEVLAR